MMGANMFYKQSAKVGRDTIEDVEYIVYSSFDRLYINEMRPTLWDKITTLFWRAKRWVKDAYWEVRYGFQRMFKGYDSVDIFETYYKFTDRYSKILTRLRKRHVGYPYCLSEEEWDDILDEMVYHLHYMVEDNVVDELKKDVPKEWSPSQKDVDEIMEKHKDEFFKLFSKYFYDLWD